LASEPLGQGFYSTDAKLDGESVTIGIKRV
jgi:hypothetical protein